jgi:hypothetical protein
MKSLLLSVCLMLVAVPAYAEIDWKPYAILAAGQTLDGLTTIRFLHDGSSCREGNRAYWPNGIYTTPRNAQIMRDKAITIGLGIALNTSTDALSRWLKQRGDVRASRVVSWLGKGDSYLGGGIGAWDGVRNLELCGW